MAMTKEQIQERLDKANENLNKAENTQVKRAERLQKLNAMMEKVDPKTTIEEFRMMEMEEKLKYEAWYDLRTKIHFLENDIKDGVKKVAEKKQIVANWESKLQVAQAEESEMSGMPNQLIKMRDELVARWDEYDFKRLREIKAKVAEYRKGFKSLKECGLTKTDYLVKQYETEEGIHSDNVKCAEAMVRNLVARVAKKCGEITSWGHLYVTQGSYGSIVLNGKVEGTNGIAIVESIDAGGYNIQRYHIRVLVK